MANGINIADVKTQAAGMFIYFSEFLKKDVLDSDGKFIGAVWDIAGNINEAYPKSVGLIIYKGFLNRRYASFPWSAVSSVDGDILLNINSGGIKFEQEPKEHEFLFRRDVLDQQVVDTFNHKVRRVNDMHLLKVERDLVIVHVDIGMRGLFRRLGWGSAVDFLVGSVNKNSDYLTKGEIISWKYVQPVAINPASMTMKLSVSERQILSIPAADMGEIIFDLNTRQRMALFRTLDVKTKARVFEHLDFEEQKTILKGLDKKEAAAIVTHMSSDEATDLLEKLPTNTVKNLLVLMESARAKKLSTLLGYSSDSAGGLMTTELVSLPETMAVGEAIEYIKNQTKEVETVPYIYLVDDKNHLKGVTTIRRLLFADPKDPVQKTVFEKTLYVHLNNSAKEVAYFMDKYKMSAIPVVDENRVLHGIITMDDILSQVISIAWRRRPAKPKGI